MAATDLFSSNQVENFLTADDTSASGLTVEGRFLKGKVLKKLEIFFTPAVTGRAKKKTTKMADL